ncbi:HupE/UreJ family protein [Marinomonas posidonica]|uniref:Urease accessory protein, putative n=1 Tax=Marinomonas posidonica (strain CECT 7376 / NCIMB 14433 / IVIA-Po-181) TaxID=491952 RepID=F6CSK7_MARPP|nr:HupE/UreJ family protein [Marinomonas posidonica]AEF56165.1 urease accessory protein, putative [Marinomonas posidonica IVIA-Po-181]
MKLIISKVSLSLILMIVSTTALAHSGHQTTSWMAGLSHPFGGLDHLLALFAVGFWAAKVGGRVQWAVPLTFLVMMLVGGGAGMLMTSLPFVEQGIVLSVIVLGTLILAAKRLPLGFSVLMTGGFAMFHGAAHSIEMPVNGMFWQYAVGFMMASILLQGAGFAVGKWLNRQGTEFINRAIGTVIAAIGMSLAML